MFCEKLNNLFDALNRRTNETGLRLDSTDFQVSTIIIGMKDKKNQILNNKVKCDIFL